MSNIVEFFHQLDDSQMSVNGVAPLDGDMTMNTPLQLPQTSNPKLQVCAITISDRIPNVFNAYPYYEFNNTIVRVWTSSTVATPQDIVLPRGLYNTVTEIQDALNSAINQLGWYLIPAQPALTITANPVTDQVTVKIDSTRLVPGTHNWMALDLRKTSTGTDMATTLGFSQGTALMQSLPLLATYFYSNQEVKMDTQGTTCDLQCSLISMRRRNDDFVRTLAIIPFAGKSTISDNVWPPAGQISPMLVYEGSKTIKYLKVEVKTMQGVPMLFMSGGVHVIISFSY